MYIRGGYNVYPAEVEPVLGEHPAVADVAVVGTRRPGARRDRRGLRGPGGRHAAPAVWPSSAGCARRAWPTTRRPTGSRSSTQLPVTSMAKVDKKTLARVGRRARSAAGRVPGRVGGVNPGKAKVST